MKFESLGMLLHQCSQTKSLQNGLSLHTFAFKAGWLNSHTFIANHVLNMYAKCGNLASAKLLFDEMPNRNRNLVSWSAMISGCDQAGYPSMAIHLYSQMHLTVSFAPNEYIFASAISACSSLSALIQGRQIHAHSIKLGYASTSFVANSLVSFYMKCSSSSDAISVFYAMDEPNSVTYNSLIGGFVENQEVINGFQVFKDMRQRGFVPDRFTFAGVLETCTSTSGVEDVNRGMQLHCQTIKFGLYSTAFIGNVLLTMYSKFNLIEEAEQVFRLIEEKDVISWNTIISSCSNCGDHNKSLILFSTMTEVHARPDNFTFASVLAACAGLALDRHGRQLHAHIIRTRFCQDVGVKNALMNMYAKCGSITSAVHVFNHMVQRNRVSWNTIIGGFANHGFAWRALEYFQRMQEQGIIPDAITFIGILMACNHAGLVDEGLAYFDSMEEMYGIVTNVEHLSCLIDMLGRAGRLKEAEEYLRKFPFGSDPVVLGSLLSACRLHGDVVIGQRLAGMLLSFHPSTTSPYVLLSNLYASDEMWNSVADARKMLKVSGLKKEPGYSLIEVEGRVEKFTIGDFSHSRVGDMMDILRRLNLEIMETTL